MLQKKGLDASVDALIDYLDPTKSQTWNVGQLRGWARVSITAYLGVVEAPDAIDALIEQLRDYAQDIRTLSLRDDAEGDASVCDSAAAALHALHVRNAIMRAALSEISEGGPCAVLLTSPPTCKLAEKARSVLNS